MTSLQSITPIQGHLSPELEEAMNNPKKLALREKCVEFEAVLTAQVIKEGLRSAQEAGKMEGEEEEKGCAMFNEIAQEQLAYHVGKQGIVGLGDIIFKQVVSRMEGIKNAQAKMEELKHAQSK